MSKFWSVVKDVLTVMVVPFVIWLVSLEHRFSVLETNSTNAGIVLAAKAEKDAWKVDVTTLTGQVTAIDRDVRGFSDTTKSVQDIQVKLGRLEEKMDGIKQSLEDIRRSLPHTR